MNLSIRSLLVTCAAFAVCASSSRTASASPWTLPERQASVGVATDLQYARTEFLPDGTRQVFPLNGEYYAGLLRLGLRYGVTDRVEIGASVHGGVIAFQADSVYLADVLTTEVGEEGSPERFRANILSFDHAALGLGDLRLFVRHRWSGLGRVVVAGELQLKLPTGYTPPSGTFEDDEFARGVADDVSFGDGQADLEPRLLFGFVPASDWFIRADVGLRLRAFGPGQQVTGALKVGTRVSRGFLPYVFADAEHSFTEGRVIGTSYATDSPEVDGSEFTADLLDPVPLRLDRSFVSAGAGAIFQLQDREVDVSYHAILWGKNIAQIHSVSIGTTFGL